MANEPTTTITGNLTADPEIRFTPSGVAVASFTIANTPRYLDRVTNQWTDAETWFVRCSAWRDLGENIVESLRKGSAVVAAGRLQARSYEATPGDVSTKRTVVEMTVDDLGPSLRRATARPEKTTRERPAGSQEVTPAPVSDPWATGACPQPAGNTSGVFSAQPPFRS